MPRQVNDSKLFNLQSLDNKRVTAFQFVAILLESIGYEL